jgi:hypothetical protein
MTGMTGSVPYYGGRFTPAQAYAAAHPTRQQPPPPPGPPSPHPPAAPSSAPARRDPRSALDDLLASGVITEEEHAELRERLSP